MALCNPGGNGPTEAGPGDGSGGLDGRLNVRTPEIDTQYGEKLWRQKRAVVVDQGTHAYLQMAIRDESGQNVDLTDYHLCNNDPDSPTSSSSSSSGACAGGIKARWREAALVDRSRYQTQPTIYDAATGIVKSIIPPQIVDKTGVYFAQFAILDIANRPLFMDDCYVYVEHSAWYTTGETQAGPPLIADVRLSLRDSDPVLNELIAEYDFDDGEIAFAVTRAVQFWNDQPPHIARAVYSTKNFPFREIWLEGAQLFLFELAEEYYRRNFFQVNAGGVVTDDKNKYQQYNAAWKERFSRFKELVMHRKAQINLSGSWASLSSGYSNRYIGY